MGKSPFCCANILLERLLAFIVGKTYNLVQILYIAHSYTVNNGIVTLHNHVEWLGGLWGQMILEAVLRITYHNHNILVLFKTCLLN